jgi:tetratricopeptide (TPR) repeat protein
MQRSLPIVVLCLAVAAAAQTAGPYHHSHAKALAQPRAISVVPVTTNSAKARALYQQGMAESMNFHLDRALGQWREAVKLDPNFALAQLMIAFRSQDPKEAQAALRRANAAAHNASESERLFVRWITGIREGSVVSGIAAMNDLVTRHPYDKQLLSLAGNWLMVRYSFDRADQLLDRALAVDPDYPPALNSAAYAHAQMGDFANAIELMQHYAEVIPNEPNAQDSYGEILRMAGKYDQAIAHYQAALKMAPGFSIMGLADTYALKGDEERARAEYRRCNEQAEMSEDRILCRLQYPVTYVWEKNYRAADQAYEETAKWAHDHDLGFAEAQAHRMMAMYQEDDRVAFKHLDRAAAALAEHSSTSPSDQQEEMARIIRWRVIRAMHAGEKKAAEEAMQQLRDMADHDPSEVVQRSYNAALGAQLVAEGKPMNAIPYLREDLKNACSLALLVKAYELTGDKEMAATQRAELAQLSLPTLETAMVLPAFRSIVAAK